MDVNAKLWSPWAAMAVMVTPTGRLTSTGVLRSMMVPSPSWPPKLEPHARMVPVDVNARLWLLPPAMAVTSAPTGRPTSTGVLRSVMVPSPNSPWSFWPQARTAPVDVNAKL